MIVGIDASNIRAGGGLTHLVELLRACSPSDHGFSRVIVWSGQTTLGRLENRPWLIKSHEPLLDKGLPYRTFWQCFKLSHLARAAACDVLFVPGGSYAGNFRPLVTISRNLLPFEWRELRRYGRSLITLKMLLLRWTQSHTFRKADGLIFLTRHAQDVVMQVIKATAGKAAIIPHGVDNRFLYSPREQLPASQYTFDCPFRVLYVSIVDMYKHQWHVADAISQLRKTGLPVVLDLVGTAFPPALKRLRVKLKEIDPTNKFVRYSGAIPYTELHACYTNADAFLFASTCETFGQILIEAMSAGLPIACSTRSAMPELLGDAGVYFDPERPAEIASAIKTLFDSPELRSRLASASFEKAQGYSWERCADETFSFIAKVACDSGEKVDGCS